MAIAGVILAGGRGSRMGGRDKALLALGGRPLAVHVAARLAPQVEAMAISANGDAGRFGFLGLDVVADADDSFAGPLAGILAGLRWAAALPGPPRALVTAAVDTPFFPADLAARLDEAAGDRPGGAVALSHGRRHPTFALWPLALADDLAAFLAEDESRRLGAFLDRHGTAGVDFTPAQGVDPFFNINTPADLAAAEETLKAMA